MSPSEGLATLGLLPTGPLVIGALLVLVVVVAVVRDRRRDRAFRAAGARLGLRPAERTGGVPPELLRLPSMDRARRHVLRRVLRDGDEILAEWDAADRQGKRRRRRIRTLIAWRHASGSAAPQSVVGDDDGPGGFGRYVVEWSGDWVACIALDRRLPPDELAAFRERARGWRARATDDPAAD